MIRKLGNVRLVLLATAMITLVLGALIKGFWHQRLGPSPTVVAQRLPPVAPPAARSGSYVGVLLPPQMANLSSRADGKLVALPVRVGQPVKPGDLLAAFDARDRRQDLAMAEASLKAAKGTAASAGADLVAARRRAARRNGAVEVGGHNVTLVSGEEAAQAILDSHSAAGRATTASAQVAEQHAKVAQLRIALEECELRAPFDGIVTAIYFEPGMNAHANETVVRVVGTGRGLRVRLAVPEEDHAELNVSQRAKLVVDAERSFYATVDRVSPEVEPSSRTFFVEGVVDVDEACRDCALLAGRTVRGTFVH
jgi:RND family efflux transporter MFP subunit